jgi:hypothetical protein
MKSHELVEDLWTISGPGLFLMMSPFCKICRFCAWGHFPLVSSSDTWQPHGIGQRSPDLSDRTSSNDVVFMVLKLLMPCFKLLPIKSRACLQTNFLLAAYQKTNASSGRFTALHLRNQKESIDVSLARLDPYSFNVAWI